MVGGSRPCCLKGEICMMRPFRPVKTAIIGCGMISKTYLENCVNRFNVLDVVACADIVPERAQKAAETYGLRVMTDEEIYNDPDIELVINTTYPTAHYEVTRAALLAGKHVHSEKMFAITLEQANELTRIAREKHLSLTSAPDTWMGSRMQTARAVVDGGLIGEPISAEIILSRCYRHSDWKQESEKRFAFCPGGGLLYDMGGYYLTALVSILGDVDKVTGFYRTYRPERPYRHPNNPLYGTTMTYDSAPNCYAGAFLFKSGVTASLSMTSEVRGGGSHFYLHGTCGTLDLGDPNNFGGDLRIETASGGGFKELGLNYPEGMRGIGAADAAYALRNNRPARCGTELIYHVFEALQGLEKSCDSGVTYTMTSDCARPDPLPAGFMEYPEAELDNL